MIETEQDFEKTAMQVSMVSIVANFVLTVFKLAAGIIARSGAMISDAIHSASDVFSTIVVMIGIRISRRDSDKDHPYGHERLECVAAIVLATILAAYRSGNRCFGSQEDYGRSHGGIGGAGYSGPCGGLCIHSGQGSYVSVYEALRQAD